MPSVGATSNVLVNGSLKRTILEMFAQDLDDETIALALEVPVELITQLRPQTQASSDSSVAPDSTSELSARSLHETEQKLQGLSDFAVDTMRSLVLAAENEGVRFAASKFVLEAANGSLRPRQENSGGISFKQINLHINQAQQRYAQQLSIVEAQSPSRSQRDCASSSDQLDSPNPPPILEVESSHPNNQTSVVKQ